MGCCTGQRRTGRTNTRGFAELAKARSAGALSTETVYRHAREGGFPANKVTPVAAFIGPETATGSAS